VHNEPAHGVPDMISPIPRLEIGEMPADLAAALLPRVQNLGYLGEFFKCTAHQPAALMAFMNLTEELKKALGDKLVAVVTFTVARLMENNYAITQHERLCLKLGFEEQWIRDVVALEREGELSGEERAVQALVLRLLAGRGHAASAELEWVVEQLGPEKAIAVLLLTGRNLAHALVVNALGLAPPVPSPFIRR
jgi:hypothetical protein